MSITILGIESSCDDTSAAIIQDEYILSNFVSNQEVHKKYGGVVPELASRAHQQNIIPVVDAAIKEAGISKNEISAIAYTRGPGLMGSLLVGTSFAKGLSIGLKIPLIEVNHLQGHILAHFIKEKIVKETQPDFPFLCLLVSGGHTQLMLVKSHLEMEILGKTIDDAAGEAFDKCGKIIGLNYPAGPIIDKLAKDGDKSKFKFNKPRIKDFDFSFSGLKTSFLYSVRDELKQNPNFIFENLNDLCASLQSTIVEILIDKLVKASKNTGVKEIAIAGGVAANSELKNEIITTGERMNWKTHIPAIKYTTDNAAMIAITGYYKFLNNEFSDLQNSPLARWQI